jgi:hypothetical protein
MGSWQLRARKIIGKGGQRRRVKLWGRLMTLLAVTNGISVAACERHQSPPHVLGDLELSDGRLGDR